MRVLGIDVSTYCGLAIVDSNNPTDIVGKCVNFPKHKGWQRLQLIADEVARIVEVWKPDRIWVEGYAIYRVSSVVTVVSCGTVVRQVLYRAGLKWQEVPPTSLKKWVCGSGNASKDDMATAVKARWGYQSPSDDIIDAVGLAQLGVCFETHAPPPEVKGVSDGWTI